MFIKIKLKSTEEYHRKFQITLKDLEEAIRECYLDLGTSYKPIPIDNFVSLGKEQFPLIPSNAKISIKLKSKGSGSNLEVNKPQLICCKVKNVGKAFNNRNELPKNYWDKVFKCNKDHIYSAPDGTLYIAPNKKNVCHISTKKNVPNIFASYSIIFSMMVQLNEGYLRRFYFILDPVVRISSNPPPNN